MKTKRNAPRWFDRPCWNLAQPGMAETIRKVVAGQEVLDIGGMDGMLAQYLIEVGGATHVTVVEKERKFQPERERDPLNQVDFFWGYLSDFNRHRVFGEKKWSVVTVSWPINHQQFSRDAVITMRKAGTVIFIGKNDGTSACATSAFWQYLVQRERVVTFLDPRNDILIYGVNARPEGQTLVPTESFGLEYDNA